MYMFKYPLPSLCFSDRSENQDGRPGLWLTETFSISPLKLLNKIQRNLTGSKISTSFTKLMFFGPIKKKQDGRSTSDWLGHFRPIVINRWTEFDLNWQEARPIGKPRIPPGLWLVEILSTSPLKPLNGIEENFTQSKISTFSTKFFLFWPIGKPAAPASDGWDIFDFSSETAERN